LGDLPRGEDLSREILVAADARDAGTDGRKPEGFCNVGNGLMAVRGRGENSLDPVFFPETGCGLHVASDVEGI
jgi:hypothetical protein